MRGILVVPFVLVLLLAAPALADRQPISLKNARELKLNGEVLTGLGLGLELGGLAMLTASALIPSCAFAIGGPEEGPCAPGPDNSFTRNTGTANALFVAGAAIAGVATAVIAVGIPLWATGAHREKVLRRALSWATGTFSF
ncbi:MAG TPA: hypothetical protein VII38_22330 [Polyangia bacterium]|jgi:hypothetical protein